MAELQIILDQLIAPVPGGVGRYTEELTNALIATAPSGSSVVGLVSLTSADTHDEIQRRLEGLSELRVSRFDRRATALAWSHGVTLPPPTGLLHSPSPLAPLSRHERQGPGALQAAVTVHDTVPWSHPETLTARGATWHRRIIGRAERYADAIVVPSHAVAAELADVLPVADRLRVIPGGVTTRLTEPHDSEVRARRMDLPERYVLSVGSIEPRKGLVELMSAMALPELSLTPLVHVGPSGWGDLDLAGMARDAGLDARQLIDLGRLDDDDLAVTLRRSTVFVQPSQAEGFGLPLLEAMAAGVPTVHTDVPALREVSAGAGLEVRRGGDLVPALADAISAILEDVDLATRLATAGRDRAGAFSWRDSAEKVWQLHADL